MGFGTQRSVYDSRLHAWSMLNGKLAQYLIWPVNEHALMLCRGQNSVNPVWDGSLTVTRETEESAPVG